MVRFPGSVLPVVGGRKRSVAAAQEAARTERPVGLLLQRDPQAEEPGPVDLHRVGTVAGILRYVTGADGTHHVVCQGEQRFRIVEYLRSEERRVGKECVSTCRSRWSPYH